MAPLFELGAQLAKVVDLAVVDQGDASILVVDRLIAALEVEDLQPPIAEVGRLGFESAGGVRAAVDDGVHHAIQQTRVLRADVPADTAHSFAVGWVD